ANLMKQGGLDAQHFQSRKTSKTSCYSAPWFLVSIRYAAHRAPRMGSDIRAQRRSSDLQGFCGFRVPLLLLMLATGGLSAPVADRAAQSVAAAPGFTTAPDATSAGTMSTRKRGPRGVSFAATAPGLTAAVDIAAVSPIASTASPPALPTFPVAGNAAALSMPPEGSAAATGFTAANMPTLE
ncbi:hypothetical protein VaNZ11_013503, partial [Volvox africanus]